MKDAKTLLLEYLAALHEPERAVQLFAEDAVFELPYLKSIGVAARYSGRAEIAQLIQGLVGLYPDFAFAPEETKVLIETPNKVYAEYLGHGTAASTGRRVHSLFSGYVHVENGRIKHVREMLNVLAMAQAQLPVGSSDFGAPGQEVHSF